MATNYKQEGGVIEHTAATDLMSGDVVVVGQLIGIALVDIATGEIGSVAIDGVFTVAKVAAADIKQGESVIWDSSLSAFEDSAGTPAAGDVSNCCVAIADAAVDALTVDVKLNVSIGTVA